MMNKKLFSIFILLVLLSAGARAAKAFVIRIASQEQFDSMNSLLTNAIGKGYSDIVINIAPGTYYYRNHHLSRANESRPQLSVRLQGNGSILIAAGNDYRQRDAYKGDFSPRATFIDLQDMIGFDFWDHCRYADTLAVVADWQRKLCRLPYAQAAVRKAADCQYVYVNIPQWYYSTTYKVDRIAQGAILFCADKLEDVEKRGRKSCSVNYDYLFGGGNTRFRLCDPSRPTAPMRIAGNKVYCAAGKTFHECRVATFHSFDNVEYKAFTIDGLHFIGNKDNNGYLLSYNNARTRSFTISHCTFEHIQSRLLLIDGTPNFTFTANTVSNCKHHGVLSTNSCERTTVTDNDFSDCGGSMLQTFCVNCKGKDYYVARNRFRNFGYSAIGLGIWHGHQKGYESSGVVERNEMWYDADYLAHKERHTLMDAGAIYLWTKHDDCRIRYNYIHDYGGVAENRGIFCDDGAYNFSLTGNVIINVVDDYSIDSRNCQGNFPYGNQNILIADNIVSSPIKFEGGTNAGSKCIVSGNAMLYRQGERLQPNHYKHLTVRKHDLQLPYLQRTDSGITFSAQARQTLRTLPAYKQIATFLGGQ